MAKSNRALSLQSVPAPVINDAGLREQLQETTLWLSRCQDVQLDLHR